ncbi:MAG: Uma2 family endonuclease [Candidatus Cyclobacteriaceae bacterium M3_2C_046]
MSMQLAKRLINVDEYYRMAETGILTEADRVELIHGEILNMSPIGSKHMAVVNRLNKLLAEYLTNDEIVSIQNPVRINDLNVPEPDISVLKYREDFYAQQHPGGQDVLLVIEVSETTFAYDKEIKLPIYASAGIPEYWIINLEKTEIEVHKLPSGDVYKFITIHRAGDKVDMPGAEVGFDADDLLGI